MLGGVDHFRDRRRVSHGRLGGEVFGTDATAEGRGTF